MCWNWLSKGQTGLSRNQAYSFILNAWNPAGEPGLWELESKSGTKPWISEKEPFRTFMWRNLLGTPGNGIENPSVSDEPTASCFGNVYARRLTVSHGELVSLGTRRSVARADELERNTQNLSIPTPKFARKFSSWNPSSDAERDYPHTYYGWATEESGLENAFHQSPSSFSTFQCWKTSFKTEVVAVNSRASIPENWDAWCEDWKDHPELQLEEAKHSGRAQKDSTGWPIPSRKTDGFYDRFDLWILPGDRRSWSCSLLFWYFFHYIAWQRSASFTRWMR